MIFEKSVSAAAHASLAALLLITVTGCGESLAYSVPEKICDRKIEQDLLRPLLPKGEKFEAEQSFPEEGQSLCMVYIDGKNSFSITEYRDQKSFNAVEYAKNNPRNFHNPNKSDISENAVISDRSLISLNACPARSATKKYILDMSIDTPGEDQRTELESFAKSYLPTGMKHIGCLDK
ncbi:hypothetical protein [Streptomyces sp. NPDC091212]|uniref:hypothetical protein n=1 Tax=Streptomyces sp. NPDC091212 TaxID=3155191 RepID=UPI003417B292